MSRLPSTVRHAGPRDDPLRSLVVAPALGVDTALKQDARGLDFTDLIDGPF